MAGELRIPCVSRRFFDSSKILSTLIGLKLVFVFELVAYHTRKFGEGVVEGLTAKLETMKLDDLAIRKVRSLHIFQSDELILNHDRLA